MTILFLILTAIIAATLLNKRKASLVLLAFLSFHLILSGGGIFTRWALRDLQRDPRAIPDWKAKNAIVILGFGTVKWSSPASLSSDSFAFARMFEGLRLYRSCVESKKECRILLTGGDPRGNGEAEAAVMARELRETGVRAEDLIVEDKSNSTSENARNSAPLLEGFDRIYLVTSGIHMYRAKLYFAREVKGVIPAPADRMHALLTVIPVSPNLIFFDFALFEYLGILRYKISGS